MKNKELKTKKKKYFKDEYVDLYTINIRLKFLALNLWIVMVMVGNILGFLLAILLKKHS
ncbi:MAG: hypothetical protein GX416_11555 [Bacteroidales bacterium]|nr:hypothetical protein [Bacteroidales bacterium]